eukprot:12468739-Alexandrium_andersonii.AAC.1
MPGPTPGQILQMRKRIAFRQLPQIPGARKPRGPRGFQSVFGRRKLAVCKSFEAPSNAAQLRPCAVLACRPAGLGGYLPTPCALVVKARVV